MVQNKEHTMVDTTYQIVHKISSANDLFDEAVIIDCSLAREGAEERARWRIH